MSAFGMSAFEEWIQHVRDEVVPKMQSSAYVMSLVPDAESVDVKFAVELGLAIMFEKPLLLVVEEGTHLPGRLALIADAIIEHDGSKESLQRGIQDTLERLKIA